MKGVPRTADARIAVGRVPAFLRRALVVYFCALALQWAVAIVYYKTATTDSLNKHPFAFSTLANFSDLYNYEQKLTHLVSAHAVYTGEPVFNYPPPTAFLYSFFLNLKHSVGLFNVAIIAMVLVQAWALWRGLARAPVRTWEATAVVSGTLLFSYPLFYELYRTNMEGIAWGLLGIGIVCFVARKNMGAAVFWGLGILVKPFPLLLFLLLLRRRRYREILVGTVLCTVAGFIALKALGPTVVEAARQVPLGLGVYKRLYVYSFRFTEARFQHSILDTMKVLIYRKHLGEGIYIDAPPIHKLYYMYLAIVLGLASVCVKVFRKLPGLNQFFAIVLVTLLLTPVSADYTLLLTYGIWGAFLLYLGRDVATGRTKLSSVALYGTLLLFSLIYSPRNYLGPYGGCFTTFALLGLLWIAARTPMYSSLFDDIDPAPERATVALCEATIIT